MNKKISTSIAIGIILFLAILVGGFTYWQFSEVQKENTKSSLEIKIPENKEVKDEITLLLGKIEKDTNIDFSEIKNIKFDWATDLTEKMTIEGKGIEREISKEEIRKIDSFLKNQGFEIDNINSGDATIMGMTGYKKDNIICTRYGNEMSIDYFACGKLEKPYIKVISPNGEEEWKIGNTYDITWESQGADKIYIYLVKEGASDVAEIITRDFIQASLGKYSWTIPTKNNDINLGGQFKIVITFPEEKNGKIRDVSDNYFSIVKKEETAKCSDGTFYNQCSTDKPKYCDEGNLVDKSSLCGCPVNYEISGNQCVVKINCQNECSQIGSRICSNNNNYQVCGYDNSNCLKWSPINSCSEKNCIMGNCLSAPLLNSDVKYWSILLATGLQKDDPNIDINSNQNVKNILIKNGWEENYIKMLTGKDATQENFNNAMDWLKNNSDSNDIVFIVLNAHGGTSGIAIEGGSLEYSKLANDLNNLKYGGLGIVIEACEGYNAIPYLKKENREILWLSGGPSLFWNALSGFGDLIGNNNNWVSAEEIYNMAHLYDIAYPSQSESIIQDDFSGELNILFLNNYWSYLDQYNTQPMIYGYGINVGAMANGAETWAAQSFMPNFQILTKVTLGWVVKHKNPGPLTLSIRETLSGPDLTSFTLPENSFLNETAQPLIDFDFPDIEVKPGKTYFIVIKAPQAISQTGLGNVYSISASINNDYYLKGKISLINDLYPPAGFVYTDLDFYTFGKSK